MKGKIFSVCYGFLILAGTVGSFAAEDPFRQAMVREQIQKMKVDLNLTEKQEQDILPVVEDNIAKTRSIMHERMDLATKNRQAEKLDQEYVQQMGRILTPGQLKIFLLERAEADKYAKDTQVKSRLRTISTALDAYAAAHKGKYPLNSDALTKAWPPYISDVPCGKEYAGFNFTCNFTAKGYTVKAAPTGGDPTGARTYTIMTGGKLTP